MPNQTSAATDAHLKWIGRGFAISVGLAWAVGLNRVVTLGPLGTAISLPPSWPMASDCAARWAVPSHSPIRGLMMFVISKEDTTTTLLGTVIGIIGFTIGCTGLLAFYLCALDLEWLRVLAVPGFITLGLFPLAMGMITPDTVSSPEYLNRYPFYFWWAGVLGLSVNLVVQYLLNPKSSHSLLVQNAMTGTLQIRHDSVMRKAASQRSSR